MSMYVLVLPDNSPVSIGSVLADPLPPGVTAVALTEAQAAAILSGGIWTGSGVTDPPPAPQDPAEQRIAELEAEIEALTLAVLA